MKASSDQNVNLDGPTMFCGVPQVPSLYLPLDYVTSNFLYFLGMTSKFDGISLSLQCTDRWGKGVRLFCPVKIANHCKNCM